VLTNGLAERIGEDMLGIMHPESVVDAGKLTPGCRQV
jgi:hypothetical protein